MKNYFISYEWNSIRGAKGVRNIITSIHPMEWLYDQLEISLKDNTGINTNILFYTEVSEEHKHLLRDWI